MNGLTVPKKSLNVESPSFTPTITPKPANAQLSKGFSMSPKAATAPAFTPRGSGSVTPAISSHSKDPSEEFFPKQLLQTTQPFNDFVPGQSFVPRQQVVEPQPALQSPLNAYGDPFVSQQSLSEGISGLDASQQTINPYAQATSTMGGQAFFQDTGGYKHPLNYHLYAAVGPRRENMLPYQRASADFFIPDSVREDLQRRADAALQTFANSTLPHSVEYFHSLVALDTNNQTGSSTFGYPTWVYKARSSRDGELYVLRRIEGFRLTSEAAIRSAHAWRQIGNASMVHVHDAFTGRWFNDSSLVIVTDYHPTALTLAEKHFPNVAKSTSRPGGHIVQEHELWSYLVQLASALKSIHEAGLAAQTVLPSKVLLTSKNRVRLNGCAVFDIVKYEQRRPIPELQPVDLEDLGRLILNVAARSSTAHHNIDKALQLIGRTYSERLRACLAWLLSPPPFVSEDGLSPDSQGEHIQAKDEYNITTLLNNIADKVVSAFDSTLHLEDELSSNLMRELENGRLVRLLSKLNVILERPDPNLLASKSAAASSPATLLNQPSSAWSEAGERYYLKLFRDYVFHQVDHEGRPVLNLGHIVTCLNKLDAGIDEKVQLVSRDEQNVFVLSFREVKRGLESAWAEISKASNPARR